MSDSWAQTVSECSEDSARGAGLGGQLRRFKPWVFRPKKVIYSLEEQVPTKKQYSTSHWTEEQNRKYIDFLLKFREVIQGEKKQRRKWHLNRIMSKYLGTRSHEQCRSHHQKMIKNYRSIDGIISHFQTRQNPTSFQEDPSTSPTASPLDEQPLPFPEESLFNLLCNPLDQESEFIRIPLFYGEESNDMF